MYLYLTWENVDLAARTLTIPRTKNGDPITLPLNGDAMRALQIFPLRGAMARGRVVRNSRGETLNVHGPLVSGRGARGKDRAVSLARLLATVLHRSCDRPVCLSGNIAELLGHKGLAMTKRYAHLSISNSA